MGLFVTQWATILLGLGIHAAADRSPRRHTSARLVELGLLWFLVAGGFWAAFGGVFHLGPSSTEIANEIGYAPSMFQWEVGWGDIAVGVLGMACLLHRNRGGWMTAATVALVISFWGDGIGHIMQWVSHDNTAPENIGALPSDFLQPLVAAVLLVLYRRDERRVSRAVDGPIEVVEARRPALVG